MSQLAIKVLFDGKCSEQYNSIRSAPSCRLCPPKPDSAPLFSGAKGRPERRNFLAPNGQLL